MSFWDYAMPHRLLINASLRKESEKLRERIDSYQIEYDRRVDECQMDLDAAEKERQEKFDRFRESLIDELKEDQKYLETIANDITVYADAYLHRKCLYRMKDIKQNQIKILQEDNNYLSEQMKLIGKEIDLLRERQNELTSFTKVDDIIRLSAASGLELNFNSADDAKTLLDKVSVAISECDEGRSDERFALMRLKEIVQERSEYLPTIKYITWVIQQKKQFSKQLSKKRRDVRERQRKIRQEIKNIGNEIQSISTSLKELAREIRYYWAHPITYLNADISYAYSEKKDTREQLKNVGEELHDMASWHSDDQDRWDQLKSERQDLSSDMEFLRESIDLKKRERKQWYKKRDYIYQLCKKYELPLIPEDKKDTDEMQIIEVRLSELKEIRKTGAEEAGRVCEQKRAKLISEYELSRKNLDAELAGLEKQMDNVVADLNTAILRVSVAQAKIKKIEREDNRFFLVKIFSDTPGMESARKALLSEKKSLGEFQKKKNEISKNIEDVKGKITELDKQHEKDLHWCTPRYLRPTAAEAIEEKKLLYRKEEIDKRRREGGYESKN